MIRISFLSAALAVSTLATAQFPYNATVLNESYLPLEDATALDLEIGWDDPTAQIPLDFSIDLDGTGSGGILEIGGSGEMLMNTTETGLLNILWPITLDVMDIGAVKAEEFSTINYQTTGEPPNRILKVEWDNCGIYEEVSLGTAENRLNFQTWIYESGDIIEFRFGPNTFNADSIPIEFLSSGVILGFDYDYYTGTFYTASGDASAPDWSLTDDFYQWYYSGANLSGVPVEGTVYRFGPVANIANAADDDPSFTTYPNPTVGSAWIQNGPEAAEFQVLDATGRIVHTFFLGAGRQSQLPSNNWETGTYSVRSLAPSGRTSTIRLVVN